MMIPSLEGEKYIFFNAFNSFLFYLILQSVNIISAYDLSLI